jgi:two-component system response regulator GlrR
VTRTFPLILGVSVRTGRWVYRLHELTPASGEGGRAVLVVDDNVALAENIGEVLESAGYIVEIAASAEEALLCAFSGRVAFIVTDYRLPGLNGAELIVSVRMRGQKIRAVIISASSDEATMGESYDAGIVDFLPKPIDFARLTRVLAAPDLS